MSDTSRIARLLEIRAAGARAAVRRAQHKHRGMPKPTRIRPPLCEICGSPPTARKKKLSLDHDHATSAFRGWLCDSCNLALGLFKDSPAILQAALRYLTGV